MENPYTVKFDGYFGSDIQGTGKVSEAEFIQFLKDFSTISDLSIQNIKGFFTYPNGEKVEEDSYMVTVLSTEAKQDLVYNQLLDLSNKYKVIYKQESVMIVKTSNVEVNFV